MSRQFYYLPSFCLDIVNFVWTFFILKYLFPSCLIINIMSVYILERTLTCQAWNLFLLFIFLRETNYRLRVLLVTKTLRERAFPSNFRQVMHFIPFKLFMQLVSQSPLSQKTFTTPAELLLSSDSFSSTLSATRVAVVPVVKKFFFDGGFYKYAEHALSW